MKGDGQYSDLRYRRLGGDSEEYINVEPTQHLSIYADAVIAEEVLDQKYEVNHSNKFYFSPEFRI